MSVPFGTRSRGQTPSCIASFASSLRFRQRVVLVVENWRLHWSVQDVPLFGASESVVGVVSAPVAGASLAGVVSVEKSSVVVASVRGLVVAWSWVASVRVLMWGVVWVVWWVGCGPGWCVRVRGVLRSSYHYHSL